MIETGVDVNHTVYLSKLFSPLFYNERASFRSPRFDIFLKTNLRKGRPAVVPKPGLTVLNCSFWLAWPHVDEMN